MKLGIMRDFTNPIDLTDEDFDKVKAQGLSFLEAATNFDHESEYFISNVENYKRSIARTGIEIPVVGRWNTVPNVGCKLDENVMNMHCRMIDATKDVGAKVYVCGCNYDTGFSLYRNYEIAIEYFKRLIDYADPKGITIAVYTCGWNNFIQSHREWEVVLGEIRELMIKYDPSHTYRPGEQYLKELLTWGRRVAHVHVKGVATAGGECFDNPPAGMDDIDWRRVMAILYAGEYKGGISIEAESDVWSGDLADPGINFTINYLKPFIM